MTTIVHDIPDIFLHQPPLELFLNSRWVTLPALADGFLDPLDWAEAGSFTVDDKATVLLKNDARALRLFIDVTSDTVGDVNDTFWVTFDLNSDKQLTPNVDPTYWPLGNPPQLNVSGTRDAKGASGVSKPTNGLVRRGFGPTQKLRQPHRYWELAIPLDELGIGPRVRVANQIANQIAIGSSALGHHGVGPFGSVRQPSFSIGVAVASGTPAFQTFPLPFNDLSKFVKVSLAAPRFNYEKAGAVVGGIGYIPALLVDETTGLATTKGASCPLPVEKAAFDGTLDFIANFDHLEVARKHHVTKLHVMHRFGTTSNAMKAAPPQPLLRHWTNGVWDGSRFVPTSFGPDADGCYDLPRSGTELSVQGLLFRWDTTIEENGWHQLTFVLDATPDVPLPASEQTLTLRVDNRLPEVALLKLLDAGGNEVQPCDIVDLTGGKEMTIDYNVTDSEGMLASYAVIATYGHDGSVPIESQRADPASDTWTGPGEKTHSFKPPVNCAYRITVRATGRTTNGYGYYPEVSDSKYVTLKVT